MKREYPLQPTVSVGVVVRIPKDPCGKGNKILLVRRGQEPRKGEWSISGGIVELGETIRETARREVQEECGIAIEVGEVLDVIDAIHRDQEGKVRYHYVLIDLAATHLSGEVKPGSDIDEARWVTGEELDKFHLYERLKSIILKALEKDI